MRLRIPITLLLTLGGLWVIACANPTQSYVCLSLKDIGCENRTAPTRKALIDMVIYVGKTVDEVSEREANGEVAASLSCESIKADTCLVLYPTDAMKGAFRIVAGTQGLDLDGTVVRTPADKCVPGAPGTCLRATRAFDYVKNETLELPVVLDVACVGKVCGDGLTCDGGDCFPDKCESRKDCFVRGGLRDAATPFDARDSKDAAILPEDAKPEVSIGTSYAFRCSNGTVNWTPQPACTSPDPAFYCPVSNSGVCTSNASCGGGVAYSPCCSRAGSDGGAGPTCCLSAVGRHPIQVTPADFTNPSVCARSPGSALCFPNANDCAGKLQNCNQVGLQGWGTCGLIVSPETQ